MDSVGKWDSLSKTLTVFWTACLFQAYDSLSYFYKSIRSEVWYFQFPLTQIYFLHKLLLLFKQSSWFSDSLGISLIIYYLPPRRRQWQPTPVLLPGKSHGWRSQVGCSPWGRKESDTTERIHFHFCALEKEMATHSSVLAWRIPGGAWWAAVCGVAQSRTWLKRLRSSSS